MQFTKNTSSGKASITGIVIKSTLGLIVVIGIVFFINSLDFPAPKKEIEKIIPNENLKLLNKKYFSILIFYLLSATNTFAENKPVDIWNLEKKETDIVVETNISDQNQNNSAGSSIYDMQSNKKIDPIKLDQDIASKEIKIVGLYDPAEYGLSIDMWSNSDGSKLKSLFKNINKYNLSQDASEIMNISMLTNAYYPNQNISEQEFLKFKSDWLIKNSNLDLIEEYLIKNQTINLHPELTRFLVDTYLSGSNIKKSCEIFSNITKPIEDEYLSKFNLYCLINYGKNEEAQLILDLKKNLVFKMITMKINKLLIWICRASR